MYIDEVGNNDLGSAEDPNHRFLSLTGVVMTLEESTVLHERIESLKRTFFRAHPDDPLILHRKELVNAKPPFEALQDESVKDDFNNRLLNLIRDTNFEIITVVIDKKEHRERYKVWKYDPYHYCLSVLLERYCMFLSDKSAEGDVLAESRGGKEDMRLKKSFRGLIEKGTDFMASDRFQKSFTSKELKVKLKASNIAGLQLCDLLAHPSRREVLMEHHLINDNRSLFGDRINEILKGKYYKGRNGNVYGKKLL